MQGYVYPTLYALFIWWFSTGVIIYLDGLPLRTFRWTLFGATGLMLMSLAGVFATRDDTSVTGAYLAFTYSMLIWAWLEVTFYLGFITGVRRKPCAAGCNGWRHFVHAVHANLYHELLTLGFAVLMLLLTWDHENRIGLWTYVLMWLMTLSAKLNVFFGVRNLNEEFLPDHLAFLRSFFRKKPINVFFPFSVTFGTMFWVIMIQQAIDPAATTFVTVGMMLVGAQMAVAILEHWLLVLPLPANLWQWSLTSHKRGVNTDEPLIAQGAVKPDVAV
jgi:putative photosynthetic complex assembly protein 2